jgi:hypothetical protein
MVHVDVDGDGPAVEELQAKGRDFFTHRRELVTREPNDRLEAAGRLPFLALPRLPRRPFLSRSLPHLQAIPSTMAYCNSA